LDLYVGLKKDDTIKGLDINEVDILLVYESHLFIKNDNNFKLKPFARIHYSKRKNIEE